MFTAGSTGVVMDFNTMKQEFFEMHEEDIICMDIHPKKQICATGEKATTGNHKLVAVYVWDI